MAQRPHIICHMTSSIDGGLHPSRYTASLDGKVKDWSRAYEAIHEQLGGDAWIVGRVTMAEMAKGSPNPSLSTEPAERPLHIASRQGPFAVALDRSGKLHFKGSDIGGDHVIVLLGSDVSDQHLAELAGDGVSYIVADSPDIDLVAALETLRREFSIETLLLEGGGGINGSFLAEGLVDELSVIVAPALDGGEDAERIVAAGDGLNGKVGLSLLGCEGLDNGVVHLRYAVTSQAA